MVVPGWQPAAAEAARAACARPFCLRDRRPPGVRAGEGAGTHPHRHPGTTSAQCGDVGGTRAPLTGQGEAGVSTPDPWVVPAPTVFCIRISFGHVGAVFFPSSKQSYLSMAPRAARAARLFGSLCPLENQTFRQRLQL